MDCDRCGRDIEAGAMVSVGARRFRNLCRTCWSVETRSSNTRLITALNEMTRGQSDGARPMRRGSSKPDETAGDRRREVKERREDQARPRWHS